PARESTQLRDVVPGKTQRRLHRRDPKVQRQALSKEPRNAVPSAGVSIRSRRNRDEQVDPTNQIRMAAKVPCQHISQSSSQAPSLTSLDEPDRLTKIVAGLAVVAAAIGSSAVDFIDLGGKILNPQELLRRHRARSGL